MELSNNVARVSGLGEPIQYLSSPYQTKPIEEVNRIRYEGSYESRNLPEGYQKKAEQIQKSPEKMTGYKPGDLMSLYA